MKKIPLYSIIILLVLAFVALVYLLVWRSSTLKGPESIAYDAGAKRFLISNTLGHSIVTMSLDGKYGQFLKKGLNSPRGIAIWGKRLYVADENTLRIIDPANGKLIKNIPIPEARMLNDLALDKTGLVYLTDTVADCVFIVDSASGKAEKLNSPLLKKPNGIIYDMPRDQMFIVGFSRRSPILSLSTKDRSITVFMDSIYSDLDGIAIDDLGRIYVSSWSEDMIFMIPQEQNRFIARFKDIANAADIYYYLPNNELIVPLFNKNKIIRIPVE